MKRVSEYTEGVRHYLLASELLNSTNYRFKSLENHLLKAYQHNFHNVEQMLISLYRQHKMYREAIYWFRKYDAYSDIELVLDVAMWYEKGMGTDINYDEAAKMYIRIAFRSNIAILRLISLYKDNKTQQIGNSPKNNNIEYWIELMKSKLKREYFGIKHKSTYPIYSTLFNKNL